MARTAQLIGTLLGLAAGATALPGQGAGAAPDPVAHPARYLGGGSSSGPLWPRLLADVVHEEWAPGEWVVPLVVLWRGRERWYASPPTGQPSGQRSTGSHTIGRAAAGAGPGPQEMRAEAGGVERAFRYDPAASTVELLGRRVPVAGGTGAGAGTTIVLVDRVDGADGPPTIVDVLTLPLVRLRAPGAGPGAKEGRRASATSRDRREALRKALLRSDEVRKFVL